MAFFIWKLIIPAMVLAFFFIWLITGVPPILPMLVSDEVHFQAAYEILLESGRFSEAEALDYAPELVLAVKATSFYDMIGFLASTLGFFLILTVLWPREEKVSKI